MRIRLVAAPIMRAAQDSRTGLHPARRSASWRPGTVQSSTVKGALTAIAEQMEYYFVQLWRCGMSVASEYEHAEQVVADVVLLGDMAAGRLDAVRVKEAAVVLLEHRRSELPGVSVAVAARLLGVSRTTVEAWRSAGVLVPAVSQRRRHEVTIDSLARLNSLVEELRRLGRVRELRDYVWWSGQDAADYADGKLAEALAELRAGDLDEEFAPSGEDLRWARQELAQEGGPQD